MVLGAITHAD
jgi:hypothetical protein